MKPGKLVDLIGMHFELSKSETRRLILQKAIKLDDKVVSDDQLVLQKSALVQVGKRRYVNFKI